MPMWLLLVVMSLATYRATRLIVADTFPPVLWLRDRVAGGWRPVTDSPKDQSFVKRSDGGETVAEIDGVMHMYVRRSRWSRFWLAELLSCSWCASGWVAAGVTAGAWAWQGFPLPVLVWLAVWAVGALIAAQEWA